MFEESVKEFLLQKAPSTVIPVGVSIEAAKKKYNLDQVYKLASNENPFGVSPKALEAMSKVLKVGHLYPDSTRDNVLKGKLSAHFGLNMENFIVTCGAANALMYTGEVFIKPGDECIISSPAYPPYYFIVFKNGGTIIDVPVRKDNMKLDAEGILSAVTHKTKMVILCNPNNPTSTALTGQEMVSLIRRLPKNVIVVVDEAYIDFADNSEEVTMVSHLAEFQNMIVIHTYSKIYGLAGVRVGFAMACAEIIQYMNKSVAARSLSTIAIEGAIAALDDEEFRKMTIKNNTDQRKYLMDEFSAMGYTTYDSQANHIYVDFHVDGEELYNKILSYGVMIRGDFPCTRISVGLPKQNKALVDAVKDLKAKGML